MGNAKLKKNEIALKEFCSQFSISQATGRNWIKLGKVVPKTKGNIIYFNQKYIDNLKKEISTNKNKALKSRRNKKFISGNLYYKSYVGDNSKNIKVVENIIDFIKESNITITDALIKCIINEYAMQIIFHFQNKKEKINNAYCSFLENKLNIKNFSELFVVTDDERKKHLETINKYQPLFTEFFEYEPNKDIMGLIYISLKNLNSRKATGTYYTPEKLVKKLNTKLFENKIIKNKKILDPCCGTGNFLLNLPEHISFNQIYAMDIDSESTYIAKLNMAIKYNIHDTKKLNEHISTNNFLKFDTDEKYDFILGNPPWGYNFSNDEKKYLTSRYYSAFGNNIESFDLFIEKSKDLLNKNGIISFILPEALLNVKSHYKIREIILNNFDIKYLEYLGNAFDGVQCPSIIISLTLTNKKLSTKNLEVKNNKANFSIETERDISADYFSFTTNDYEYKIIKKINNLQKVFFLKNNSLFALGIVTGDNNKYISSKKTKNNEMIVRGKDIYKYKYHNTEEYIDFIPEQYQQVAPTEYYRTNPKLLYRFISNKLVFAYDDKQTLSLNSCNILIPTIKNVNIKYIMAILNSTIAQFYFDKNFNSIKILRSHIESIPIPNIDKKEEKKIIKKVDLLLNANSNDVIKKIYNDLDNKIANIYNINYDEYAYITEQYNNEENFLYSI